jgi:hypothetical protein
MEPRMQEEFLQNKKYFSGEATFVKNQKQSCQ